jgi:hypothetical protein
MPFLLANSFASCLNFCKFFHAFEIVLSEVGCFRVAINLAWIFSIVLYAFSSDQVPGFLLTRICRSLRYSSMFLVGYLRTTSSRPVASRCGHDWRACQAPPQPWTLPHPPAPVVLPLVCQSGYADKGYHSKSVSTTPRSVVQRTHVVLNRWSIVHAWCEA